MTPVNNNSMSDSVILFSSDDEESEIHKHESKQFNSLTAMLKGVPPPSSITISKFTVEEMLQKYHENKELYGFGLDSNHSVCNSNKKDRIPFLNYSNSSNLCEKIASLMQKVQERYVQLETLSTCNIWFNSTIESCGSAKKRLRMRHGIGVSPGRRLSHLARRRQFFSSANLQRLASTDNIRQIQIKRKDICRSDREKMARDVEYEKLKSSKRALFLSPENGTPTKYGNTTQMERKIDSSGSDERRKLPLQEKSKKVEVLKWLSQHDFDADFPRKRLREECTNHSPERKGKCPRRSLNFADEDVSVSRASITSHTSGSSNSNDKKTSVSMSKLSQNHKNKLLWAVSVVLKENNIPRNHEAFKGCASTLFHKCRKNFDEILNSQTGSGTSEKVLHYARKEIPAILKEFGIQVQTSNDNSTETEKNKNDANSCRNNIESKENIYDNNSQNVDRLAHNCRDPELGVFKTPKKVRRKRKVMSCQKASNSASEKKKNGIRRWHSLESLIESAVESSLGGHEEITLAQKLENCEIVKNSSEALGSKVDPPAQIGDQVSAPTEDPHFSNLLPVKDSFESGVKSDENVPLLVNGCCPLMFSPIPSSVKEDSNSPNNLYPSLCKNNINHEGADISDLNSSTSEVDENKEILNQDEELRRAMQRSRECILLDESHKNVYGKEDILEKEESCFNLLKLTSTPLAPQPLGAPDVFDHRSVETSESFPPLIFHPDDTIASDPEQTEIPVVETKSETERIHSAVDFSYMVGRSCIEGNEQIAAGEDKNEKNHILNRDRDDGEPEPSAASELAVEKGTYKPRKLVVKKSKPNWKVVRKNSEEAENESELRLKMRLSHEWEIIGRNSSCSDIGNNSECEVTSLNCSQVSSTNDEKDCSSEVEAEDSNRRSSTVSTSFDETADQVWNTCDLLVENNEKHKLQSSVPNGENVGDEGRSECEVHTEETQMGEVAGGLSPKMQEEARNSSDYIGPCAENVCGGPSSDTTREREQTVTSTMGELEKVHNEPLVMDVSQECSEVEEAGSEQHESAVSWKNEDKLAGDNALPNFVEVNGAEKEGLGPGWTNGVPPKDAQEEEEGKASPILFIKSPFVKSSRKFKCSEQRGDIRNSMGPTPEGDASLFEEGRESASRSAPYDSESGNSSASCGPERKKCLLSWENYKARKLKEASDGLKTDNSCPQSDEKDISFEENAESITKKKMYYITLKRKHKHKDKYRDRDPRKHKMKHRRRDRRKSEFDSRWGRYSMPESSSYSVRTPVEEISDNGDSPCADKVTESDLKSDSGSAPISQNGGDVNVQTVVEAFTVLSNLVEQQIKQESEKMALKASGSVSNLSAESSAKKSIWMDIVSSWCRRNLKQSTASLEHAGSGGSSAVKKVSDMCATHPPDTHKDSSLSTTECGDSSAERSSKISSSNGVGDLLAADMKRVAETVNAPRDNGRSSGGTHPTERKSSTCGSSLLNPNWNDTKLSSTLATNFEGVWARPENTQNGELSGYSQVENAGTGKESFQGVQIGLTDHAVQKYVLVQDKNGQADMPQQYGTIAGEVTQPSHSYNFQTAEPWSKVGLHGATSLVSPANGGDNYYGKSPSSSEGVEYGQFVPVCGNYLQPFQPVYNFPNNYLYIQKSPIAYCQPNNVYNYPNWQISYDANSWGYQGNVAAEGLQSGSSFPCQVPNIPCYYNNH